MEKLIGVLGIVIFIGVAYLLSENKKRINWKLVISGIVLQIIFALLVLKVPLGQKFFAMLSDGITTLLGFTAEGTTFLFGELVSSDKLGFIFALQVLPTIIFFSALMGVLYYLGIMQIIISVISKGLAKLLGTSGAETTSAVANIFLSQNEAPLVVKPYISTMTKSELLAIMTGGMATVAGSVMAGYIAMGVNAGHLLAASIMAAPAGLVFAKMLVPETEEAVTKGGLTVEMEDRPSGLIEAAAIGASEGLQIALGVGAMLLAFIALIALANALLGWVGSLFGMSYLSINWIFGWLFAPVAYVMGIPSADVLHAGELLGQKIVLNEFVAYSSLSELIQSGVLQEKTIVILTYALCGFANFSSIAIQIGSIGGLAPNRRSDVAKLGIKALIGGSLSAFMTATIAGILF
ncbi:NupC/NupG family nucleoside CNT transporter [Clostridium frigidicarnis]|uniref:Nucleoside permease n=1 Tax=Clostridium frigidicarnis TaxID=84698 RepID=A0A1I0WZZ2_9CLOT|nr:NupC/NupG family nucleoside CNT transporter [Clostridium frigidicarnis]SFA93666.1 concentrative nucleoside transporter, CNT family [Clostridium frigidicarnis]